jgi:2-polyprenyl-3-methyl-5-hydroxy-6-metoxy-1,4-benzoquinol methylase
MTSHYCDLCRSKTAHRKVLSHWDNAYYVDKELFHVLRCEACGLAQVGNKPSGEALLRYYPANYYAYDTAGHGFLALKAAAARVARSFPRSLANHLLLNELYVFPGHGQASVLDVGCGDGSALRFFRALGFANLHGTEIDPGRRSALERDGISVTITSDLRAAALPGASFDVVRLSHVLEHVTNPRETIAECRRLLKDRGTLLLAVPNFDAPASRLFGRYFCGLQLPTHLYHFNKSTLIRLLDQYGFTVKKLRTIGYSGFSCSLLTLLRDRYGHQPSKTVSAAVVLAWAPAEAVFDLMGLGYIIALEAVKQ